MNERAGRLAGPALFGLVVGPLLTMIDSSIVNVAVADIVVELRADLTQVQWVVSGYLLALAAGLAASAYLARRFGTLPVYRLSLVGFVVASALCAVAPNVSVLVAARVAQGLVGAPLVPVAMSVLLGRQGATRRIPVTAGLVFFLAPALGPTLGGLLIAAGGWPWIFLVNVPVGLAGLIGLRRAPSEATQAPDPMARFDPIGLAMLAAGLTLALYGTSRAAITGWGSGSVIVPLATGVGMLAGYSVWASRRPQPAVDLAVLRHGQSALALVLVLVLSVVSTVVAFAAVFLLPVFTQSVQHHSALATGMALLPQGIITGLGTALGQRLATRITVRTLVVAGFAVLAGTSACLLLLTATTPLWVTATILSGRAVAIGFGITPLLFAMLKPLSDPQLADGNTVFNIAQRLGGSLGVSLLATLLAARAPVAGPVASFHEIGLLLTGLALTAAVLALKLDPIRQPTDTDPVEL